MIALRTSVLWSAAVLAALLLASVARAEAPKPTLIGSLPIGFTYTHDEGDDGVEAQSPTGIQVEYITPYYIGVGIAQYKSGIKKDSWDLGDGLQLADDLGMTYNFIQASINYVIGPVMLAWGYGAGTVTYDPETTDTTQLGFSVKWKKSQAFERFIRAGIYVNPNWSIHLAYHALYAEADQEFSVGGKNSGQIGAIMTTAGVGYTF